MQMVLHALRCLFIGPWQLRDDGSSVCESVNVEDQRSGLFTIDLFRHQEHANVDLEIKLAAFGMILFLLLLFMCGEQIRLAIHNLSPNYAYVNQHYQGRRLRRSPIQMIHRPSRSSTLAHSLLNTLAPSLQPLAVDNFMTDFEPCIWRADEYERRLTEARRANSPRPRPQPLPRKRALIFGILYRGTDVELGGCINDARAVFEMASKSWGFDEILVLTDDTKLKPTRHNMLQACRWFVSGSGSLGEIRRSDPPMLRWWQNSSHGAYVFDDEHRQPNGRKETLIPIDFMTAGEITNVELHEIVVKALANKCGQPLTAVFDNCHSAADLFLPHNWLADEHGQRALLLRGQGGEKTVADVVTFSACMNSQTAADMMTSDGRGFGAMTDAVLTACKQHGDALTYEQLLCLTTQTMINRGLDQRPQMSSAVPLLLNAQMGMGQDVGNSNSIRHRVKELLQV